MMSLEESAQVQALSMFASATLDLADARIANGYTTTGAELTEDASAALKAAHAIVARHQA